jgi:hypothetical protein
VREAVRPNPGFWKQLRVLERQLVEAGGALDDSLKLDDTKDRRALHNIEALDSESRLVAALGTAVSFQLEVENAAAARVKLNMRQAPPAEFAAHADTLSSRAVNLMIGGIVQNVDILSPTSIGNSCVECRHRSVFYALTMVQVFVS